MSSGDRRGKLVRAIEAGKGYTLTYTNQETKAYISFESNGTVKNTTIDPDTGIQTVQVADHTGLLGAAQVTRYAEHGYRRRHLRKSPLGPIFPENKTKETEMTFRPLGPIWHEYGTSLHASTLTSAESLRPEYRSQLRRRP